MAERRRRNNTANLDGTDERSPQKSCTCVVELAKDEPIITDKSEKGKAVFKP